MRKHGHTAQAGFSLVELSIVLVIIGMVAGSALSVGMARTVAARQEQTLDKMDKIEDALGGFLILNRRLPFPADPALSGNNFGDEVDSSVPAEVAAVTPSGSSDIYVGSLPYRTLGLPEEFSYDGWGRRFTYAVDTDFVDSALFTSTTAGKITIEDAGGNIIVDGDPAPDPPAGAIMVLISHGDNGHGAWQKNGVRFSDVSLGGAEDKNTDTVASFDFDNVFVQAPRSLNFDDRVRYKMKWQMVRLAGGVLSEEVCELARRTIEPPDLSATPVTGPIGCHLIGNALERDHCNIRQFVLATAVSDLCFY